MVVNYQLGLIGFPLGHSLSPKIHTAALQACRLNGNYSLFSIHPQDVQGVKDLLDRVRVGEIHGLNVTIPHKQNVIPLMDELTPIAKSIGAVNTIYLKENKLIGDNTDAVGFLSDLKKFIGDKRLEIGNSALVLGAGGSARAVVYALLNDGWKVTIASRRIEQAQELAESVTGYKLQVTSYLDLQPFDRLRAAPSTFNLLVNTTPLGMSPNIDQTPLPENFTLHKDTMIYDLVYNPRETKLVREARAQGCSATTGLGMLVEQAARAFEIWTGCNPPRDILFEAVNK